MGSPSHRRRRARLRPAAKVLDAATRVAPDRPMPVPDAADTGTSSQTPAGHWSRVSVWHGGADGTVIPSNAREIVKQWTDVHGLPEAPSTHAMDNGYPRQVWVNTAGEALIESYTITNMAHGTPLATGAADHECGAAGPFLLEVGISSSYHIAKFFGLTADARQAASSRKVAPQVGSQVASTDSAIAVAAKQRPADRPALALPQRYVMDGEVLPPERNADTPPPPPPGMDTPLDIGAVITKALTAAGLMRGR